MYIFRYNMWALLQLKKQCIGKSKKKQVNTTVTFFCNFLQIFIIKRQQGRINTLLVSFWEWVMQ